MTSTEQNPGRLMAAEIAEQPTVWNRLLDNGSGNTAAVARRITAFDPRLALFVARGTSDHAALYAKYLIEIILSLPAGLVSASTTTVYGARPDLHGVLYVAISQSGGSPDLVQAVDIARRQGALTVAITNNPDSALAEAADCHLDVMAGPELSVAATKSYTAELLALYLLIMRVAAREGQSAAAQMPEIGERVLQADDHMRTVAQRYLFAQRLVVTGRGFAYATAREAALKLMETSYLSAQAFSGADLLHGPLATIDSQVPVLAVVPEGRGGKAMGPVLDQLAERRADVFGVGDKSILTRLAGGIALPAGVPEELSPLLEIIPLQQLALHLAVARGDDPDTPRGLHKVTKTL